MSDTQTKREARLKDIREHPEKHQHSFADLQACAFVDGALDCEIIQAHEGLAGRNGYSRCDVLSGCCSCGAWH